MCVHMCIWVNLRVRAHITVTSLWFVRIACYVIAWGTGSVRAGDETGKFFAQLSLYMAFTFQSWVSMPQATRARRKLRDLLVHLGRKYFVPVWRSTFPPPHCSKWCWCGYGHRESARHRAELLLHSLISAQPLVSPHRPPLGMLSPLLNESFSKMWRTGLCNEAIPSFQLEAYIGFLPRGIYIWKLLQQNTKNKCSRKGSC